MSETNPGAGERVCPDCGHQYAGGGCVGPQTPSDRWAGVYPDKCDCDGPCAAEPDAGDVEALTEAEREQVALACDAMFYFGDTWIRFLRDGNETVLLPVIERILAARLAAVRREAEVRALTEAADDMVWDFDDHPVTRADVREWLHTQVRAARLGGA